MKTETINEKKKFRCAIYTRKSIAEGLETDFNTLDAQREAGMNYIASQKNEGWIALEKHYDDGGFTGGNMERPALQELFDDIRNDKIDIVVVYKVDRLSRSIMDFAKIVELFEKHKVSFVSVTQHFNTKDSMGRLTLNILLSFAQFEREIISERIRDKIAASKKRGKWVGGIPLLGYDIIAGGREITVNEVEAQLVRDIFSRYLECRSVSQTVAYLNENGIRNKKWTTYKGAQRGGKEFAKTSLWKILRNPTYISQIVYKGEKYKAEWEAIIDNETFDAVQKLLKENGCDNSAKVRNKYNAILSGKVYCANCNVPMTHSYTKKSGNKIYRYYICSKASKLGWDKCPYPSLPAAELENFVLEEIAKISEDVQLRDEVLKSFDDGNAKELAEISKHEGALRKAMYQLKLKSEDASNKNGDPNALTDLKRREIELSNALVDAQTRRKIIVKRMEYSKKRLEELFGDFYGIWANLNFKEQYELIDLLIERVTFDGKLGEIFITFRNSEIDKSKEL